ncbi:ABC transporter permease [Sciscionella marina]|uniref:ABC transporter permease n=1 Tax=Sciscionella marina TaxID=508770 RepID=UPI000362AC80|nr:ABC transporter permease [Sciscionella marina]
MSVLEVLRFALRGILANKMRSVLTILGIVIGVAAVILLTAMGNGAQSTIQSSIFSLGTDTLTITGKQPEGKDAPPAQPLTQQDVTALSDRTGTPDVSSVSPVTSGQANAARGTTTYHLQQVVGSTPSYFDANSAKVAAGAVFSEDDVAEARKVVVLGSTVAEKLFGQPAQAPGQQVLIDNLPFTVAGVLQRKGSGGIQTADDLAVAPLTTIQDTITGHDKLNQVLVKANSSNAVSAAQSEVSAILDDRHHITDPAKADYQVTNPQQLLSTINTTLDAFTTLLASIAGISLLVGGIGITNIMLVTVAERTREIGLRKALGARKGAILGQFLAESTVLSLLGGGIGVLLGFLGSQIRIGQLQPAVSVDSVILAVGVSVLIGLFFGSYPANRAASLRPIEALRHE